MREGEIQSRDPSFLRDDDFDDRMRRIENMFFPVFFFKAHLKELIPPHGGILIILTHEALIESVTEVHSQPERHCILLEFISEEYSIQCSTKCKFRAFIDKRCPIRSPHGRQFAEPALFPQFLSNAPKKAAGRPQKHESFHLAS